MVYQIGSARRPIEGASVAQTSIFQPNQPELLAFSQRESWRHRQTVTPWLDNLSSAGSTGVLTGGIDWVQPHVDVIWV